MRRKPWFGSIAAALAGAAIAACGASDDSSSRAIIAQCIPGTVLQCQCPNGSSSTQSCNQDGVTYSSCLCGAGGSAAGSGGGVAGGAGVAAPGMSPGMSGTPMAGSAPMTAGSIAPAPGMGGGGAGAAGMMAAGAGGMSSAGSGGAPAAGAGGSAGSVAPGDDVPANEHCQPAAMWDPAWVAFEEEVLELVNANRAMGWNCDSEGQFGPAPPLTMNPYLRCSARLHSKDMSDRGFFAHDNPDGDGPSERMDAAGYTGSTWGENIAMGQSTPEQVVAGWMDSDGHCANIMRPEFTEIGVGFVQGATRRDLYWTQNFGAPCTGRWCM